MIRQGTNILNENSKKRLDFKPELKQINFLDRRVYKRDEGVYYPSVTTILQYMPKNKFCLLFYLLVHKTHRIQNYLDVRVCDETDLPLYSCTMTVLYKAQHHF